MDELVNALCFLAKDDKFLIAKHSSHAGRWWNGIGGPTETGETLKQSTIRRLRFDLGVEVEASKIRELRRITADGVEFSIMTTKYWEGEPSKKSFAIRDLRWMKIEEMPWKDMYPGSEFWLPKILELHFTPDLSMASN